MLLGRPVEIYPGMNVIEIEPIFFTEGSCALALYMLYNRTALAYHSCFLCPFLIKTTRVGWSKRSYILLLGTGEDLCLSLCRRQGQAWGPRRYALICLGLHRWCHLSPYYEGIYGFRAAKVIHSTGKGL